MQRNSRLLPSSEITLGNLQAGKPEAAPHAHDPRPIFQYEQHLLDTVVRPEPSLFKPVIGRVIMFRPDRKSTRLNSSHVATSYAVLCLKKKKTPSKYDERAPVQTR